MHSKFTETNYKWLMSAKIKGLLLLLWNSIVIFAIIISASDKFTSKMDDCEKSGKVVFLLAFTELHISNGFQRVIIMESDSSQPYSGLSGQ